MPATGGSSGKFRFGVYEVDLRAGELRRNGLKIKIQEQPYQVLAALLERPGEIVSREELRSRLWPSDTFVEFDHSLTVTIGRLREALGDASENPIFIETIPRRGYKFIAPVEIISGTPQDASERSASAHSFPLHSPVWNRVRRHGAMALGCVLAVAIAVGTGIYLTSRSAATHTQYTPHKIMLAVLPFENLSGDAHQEYVSDAMTEELITHLGRLAPVSLGVIARTSVMKYKGSREDVKQIGSELGVSYVLEGSVRRGAARISVTAQLIQASDQTHLWAETYDRPITDVFTIERDVALHIAQSLALTLLPGQKSALARAETLDTAAYDDYLRGASALAEGTEAGFQSALGLFRHAVARDHHYAMAYAGLGQAYLSLGDYHLIEPAESFRKADQAVSQGIEADPTIPELYALRASVLSRQAPSQPRAEDAYRRALELNPSDADAHVDYALYLRSGNRLDEARGEAGEALVLDPLSPFVHVVAGWVSLSAGRLDEAQGHLKKALQLDSNYPPAMYFLGHVMERRNQAGDAIAWYQKAVLASGRKPKYLHALAMIYGRTGHKEEARALLAELKTQANRRYVDPEYISSLQDLLRHRIAAKE